MRESQSSLTRAMRLLDAFTETDGEVHLVDLAKRSGLPISTAHRMADALVEWGGLERTPRGLRLGMHMFELGQLVSPTRILRDAARPTIEELHEATRLTVNVAILDRNELVYVERIAARDVVVPTRPGFRAPLHCTALGKCILMIAPSGVVDQVLAGDLDKVTPHTITSRNEMRRHLARVRTTGLAVDNEEIFEGWVCVGAPITWPDGPPAAISLSAPLSTAEIPKMAPLVRNAATKIGARLRE